MRAWRGALWRGDLKKDHVALADRTYPLRNGYVIGKHGKTMGYIYNHIYMYKYA